MSATIANKRKSGIELLRILCIIAIIAAHYSHHGGIGEFGDNLNANQYFTQLIGLFSRTGCAIFAIISGFFLCVKEDEYFKHCKKVIPLIAEMFFYSIVILAVVLAFNLVDVSKPAILKAFFPIFWGNWFVVYYVLLYLLVPFINPYLRTLSKRRFLALILLLMLVWSVVPTFTLDAWSFSMLDFFLVYYFIGAYIRLHMKAPANRKKCCICVITCAALIVISVFCMDYIGLRFGSDAIVRRAHYFSGYQSVLAVPFSVALFLLFRDFSFSNRFVNGTASHVLGIYLIHENDFMRTYIWHTIFPNADYMFTSGLILHAFIKIFAVFFICLTIDVIRERTVGRLFKKWLDRHYEGFANSCRSLCSRIINLFD